LKILSLQLADKDYEVVTVDTPRAAFELLAARRIGVIISDQRMPEMSGTEFLSRVRTLYPTTIRMMLTGNTNLDILAQAVNEGAIYKFITKPWDRNYLREQVSEAIKAASLQVH
jgi:DNA-binding NtrC family response regulator